MRERRAECPNCGAKQAKGARFCAECGTRLEASTEILAPPQSESGPVPVTVTVAEPRLFGVTPPILVFAFGVAALAVAILLLATGRWLAGTLSLAAALLLLAAFAEVARRKPDGALARASAGALGAVRAQAAYAVEVLTTRSRATREIVRIRGELLHLADLRDERVRALGEAVYRVDKAGTKAIRGELSELDGRIETKEAELSAIVTKAQERVKRARLQVQPTEAVELPEPPAPAPDPDPPTPAPVPEPAPTPVPEPYPPPDEATPPEPARIPEPGPLGRKRKKK